MYNTVLSAHNGVDGQLIDSLIHEMFVCTIFIISSWSLLVTSITCTRIVT